MDFVNLIRIIKKRFWLLLILPVISVPIVIILTANLPKAYATFITMSTGMTGGGVSLNDDMQRFAVITQTNNMLELAKSRMVLHRTGLKALLHDLESDRPFRKVPPEKENLSDVDKTNLIKIIKQIISNSQASLGTDEVKLLNKGLESRKYSVEFITKSLKIIQLSSSDFLRISFEAENAELVAFILNTIAETFIETYKDLMAGESTRSRKFFEKQVEITYNNLSSKEQELQEFKLANNVIDLNEQIRAAVAQYDQLVNLLNENERRKESLKASIWKIESQLSLGNAGQNSFQEILMNSQLLKLKDRLKVFEQEYLRLKFSEVSASNLTAVEDSIKNIKSRINTKIYNLWLGNYIDPQETKQNLVSRLIQDQIDLEIANANTTVIARETDRLQQRAEAFTPLEASYSRLSREIQVAEKEYLEMLDKLNLARAYESNTLSASGMKILEWAVPPEEPVASKRFLLIILSGLGSFMFGLVSIFIIEYLDISLRSVKQVEKATDSVVISGFPNIPDFQIQDLAMLSSPINMKFTILKELLRKVRNYLTQKIPAHSTILITSPRLEDGKTVLSISTAIVFALAKYKTALVDLNFRNPQVGVSFGLKSEQYFQDTLGKSTELDKIKVNSGFEFLDLYPARMSNISPIETAGKDSLQKLISNLKKEYDYVIIDSPAYVLFPDTSEIADLADTSIFLLKSGEIFHEAYHRALVDLKSRNADFQGIIFNYMDTDFLKTFFGEIDLEIFKQSPQFKSAFMAYTKQFLSKSKQ